MQVERVREYVARRFPEMAGVKPSVSHSQGKYRFTFKKSRSVEEGRLVQIVRVTSDEDGNVLKVSVSR
jgi:hypothetical protein